MDYREEINSNIKTTLEEIKQLRPRILPYQAFAYFVKCIPRIIGEELCRRDESEKDKDKEEKKEDVYPIIIRAEKANFLAKRLYGKDRPKVTPREIHKISVEGTTLIEVSLDVIPTLSQRDIDEARAKSGKDRKDGKGGRKPSGRTDAEYDEKNKIPLFATFSWTWQDVDYYAQEGGREWPKPIKGLDAGREFSMMVKSGWNSKSLEFGGIITSCQLPGKKKEEYADKGSRMRRLEAPVAFSFITENVKEVGEFLKEEEWEISEIAISGVLVDSRGLSKIEQIALPRLISQIGLGGGQIEEEDYAKMGEAERKCFEEILKPPRALGVCEKVLAWYEEALRGIPTLMKGGETLKACIIALEENKETRESVTPPFAKIIKELGLNVAWASFLRTNGTLLLFHAIRAIRMAQGNLAARILLIAFHAAHSGRQADTLGPPGTGKSTVTILLDAIGMTVDQLYQDVLLAATNRTNQNLARAWKEIAEEGTLASASVSRHPARTQEPVVGIDRSLWADHVKAAVCVSTHAKADLALQQAYFNPLRATFHTYDEDQNITDMSTATTQGVTDGNTMDCRQGDNITAAGAVDREFFYI